MATSQPSSPATSSSTSPSPIQRELKRELLLLLALLLAGVLLLPPAVYFVGQAVFGDFAGGGFGAFYRGLFERLRNGEYMAWFLLLAPYLGVQTLRGTVLAWRIAGRTTGR